MIIKFKEVYLEELSKDQVQAVKQRFSEDVVKKFRQRIFQMKNAKSTFELRNIKSLHFEKLKEKRYENKYSIRLNEAYRIIFGIDKQGSVEIILIEEISNHYS